MMKSLSACLVLLLGALAASPVTAAVRLKVTPAADGKNIPVSVALHLDRDKPVEMHGPGGVVVPGQVVAAADGEELHWILPEAKQAEAQEWQCLPQETQLAGSAVFSFNEEAGSHVDLSFGERKVTRLMTAYDPATKDSLFQTYKVYTHVFDPAGKDFITKAVEGQFPHHRGIFIGFSKTKYGKQSADTWHMKDNSQIYRGMAGMAAGPVLGQMVPKIEWTLNGNGGVILKEERSLTAYAPQDEGDGLLVIDFDTTLTAVIGDIELNGDPEHAGCQYRPHASVKDAKYLFHAEGIDPKKDHDLPWVAESHTVNGAVYNVAHLSHPTIPKGNRYSAYRPYGRFGAYFVEKIPQGESLRLRYRFLIAKGGLQDRAAYQAAYEAFAHPPVVEVLK